MSQHWKGMKPSFYSTLVNTVLAACNWCFWWLWVALIHFLSSCPSTSMAWHLLCLLAAVDSCSAHRAWVPIVHSQEENSNSPMGNLQRSQKYSELAEETKHKPHSPRGDQIAQFSLHLAIFRKQGAVGGFKEGFPAALYHGLCPEVCLSLGY